MNALTDEQVAEEFRRRFQHYDGYKSEARQADLLRVFAAGAQCAEAATRAAVAADIRAAIYPEWVHQFSATVREAFGSGVNHAARIAEGKQP